MQNVTLFSTRFVTFNSSVILNIYIAFHNGFYGGVKYVYVIRNLGQRGGSIKFTEAPVGCEISAHLPAAIFTYLTNV